MNMTFKNYEFERELLDEFLSEKKLSWKSFLTAIALNGVVGK